MRQELEGMTPRIIEVCKYFADIIVRESQKRKSPTNNFTADPGRAKARTGVYYCMRNGFPAVAATNEREHEKYFIISDKSSTDKIGVCFSIKVGAKQA